MKFKKKILTAGTLFAVTTPLAMVIACESKEDELVFDGYKETPREFTIAKNKILLEEFIKPVEKKLRQMVLDAYQIKTIPKAKEAKDKLEVLKAEVDSYLPKFKAFNDSIIGKEYNILSDTYLKALDLVDISTGSVTTEGNINRVYKQIKEQIGITLKNLTASALQGLVIYSDTQTKDKNNVTKNSFWVDENYINNNIDQTDEKLDWNNVTIAWSKAIAMKADQLSKKKQVTDDYELSEKLIEFARNAILVYTEDNGQPKVVQGDVNVKVERGNAASQEDVANAMLLLSDGKGNRVSWTNIGDTSKQDTSGVKWFKKDEFWFEKSAFQSAWHALDNSEGQKFIDQYRTYLETETGKKYPQNIDLLIRNSDDYYKFIEIAAKSVEHGRTALANLTPRVFKQLPDNKIFSIIIQKMAINGNITIVDDLSKIDTTTPVPNGVLIVSTDDSPWKLFPQIKDKKTLDDAVTTIANEYGEAGIKAMLMSTCIPGVDWSGTFKYLPINNFSDAGDADWRQPLARFVNGQS